MIIYKITNKINGKCYIGQTRRSLKTRIIEHSSKKNRYIAISSAINKYGIENFLIETIYKANSLEELNKKEDEFIKEFNALSPAGYNLKTGGDSVVFSEETKEKMSKSASGENHRLFGKHHSKDTKKKMSRSHMGMVFSEEHKMKMRMCEDVCKRKKPVVCNETLQKYDSLSDAARNFNVTKCSIHAVLCGRLKTVKGFTFSYL